MRRSPASRFTGGKRLAGLVFLGLFGAQPAYASFHLMQIEQVIGGVNGDTTAQAIQLRLRSGGQNVVSQSRIRCWDAAGMNPILLIDITANVPVSAAGSRVLIASTNFASHTTPAAVPNFTMTNLIPANRLAAGSITFEADGGTIYWRLSWGGANYTGTGAGSTTNDADGNFNPPFGGAMPTNGARAILFPGAAGALSTNNAADYMLTAGAATFRNNAGTAFAVNPCVVDGDCNDGLACTDNMCSGGSCTFTPNDANCPDDGMFCNGSESCDAILGCVHSGNPCMPPTPFCDEDTDTCGACDMDAQCNDGIACSMDTCMGGFCNYAPDHASCNNGQFCDGVEICNIMMGGCQSPGTPCDAGEVCDEAADVCEPGPIRIKLVPVGGTARGSGLISPVYLTHASDGTERLFVVDQAGYIRVIENDMLLPTPFLDLSLAIPVLNANFDERGVLGLAFHPDYLNNGRFFVRYSVPRPGMAGEPCFGTSRGCHKERLSEFQVSMADPNEADAGSEIILFEVDKPQFNHDGGQVAFGPGAYLFFSMGDGGGAHDGLADGNPPGSAPSHGPIGNGQNRFVTLGKVLRLDVGIGATLPDDFPGDPLRNYAIPPTNPFADGMNGAPEIYAYGFRNPYRFSFDRANNDLYVADVGQALYEEVDLVTLGGNYGWAAKEGNHFFDPFNPGSPPMSCLQMWADAGIDCMSMINPISEYTHAQGGLAIVGGYVYRGTDFPALDGIYVYGDYSADFGPTGRLYYFETTGPNANERVEFVIGGDDVPLGKVLKGIGEDEDGEVYICGSDIGSPTTGTGVVYRLAECVLIPYGDLVFPFGVVDIDDLYRVLDGFSFPEQFPEADIHPCGGGDGDVDIDDLLTELDAFSGFALCSPSCQ